MSNLQPFTVGGLSRVAAQFAVVRTAFGGDMSRVGPVFSWRSGNRFELLVDGEAFFPRMLQRIQEAHCWIGVEFYLVENGECAERFLDALIEACHRGVRVRCLLDAFGSARLGQAQRTRLIEAGAELRLYNPLAFGRYLRNFHRDHRKLLLVDGLWGFVGGAGITDEFWHSNARAAQTTCWHEVMVEIQGPLLRDWQALFEGQWQHHDRWGAWPFPLPIRVQRSPPFPLETAGVGRVAYAANWRHRDILYNLLRQLYRAQRQIYLATPYFLPTRKIRRALMRAARRGVDVRLLLSGQHTDHPEVRYAGQRHYTRLLQAGVRIYEYRPRFVHLKMALVDDWVTLGSCNFDHWNLRWNLEANLEAVDPHLNKAVLACFEQDFAESQEVDLASWQARPWWSRFYQRLWGYLDRWLIYLSNGHR